MRSCLGLRRLRSHADTGDRARAGSVAVTYVETASRPVVNDVHSALNPTTVAEIVSPGSLAALQRALRRAAAAELPVSVAGGRHAMGGQQFRANGVLLDTTGLRRVLHFDRERGLIEVEAGMQWPELLAFLDRTQRGDERPWAFRQKQTGADRLSLGGAVSANAHGRGLAFGPLVEDVEALTVVGPRGEFDLCSRSQNRELFRRVVGGYGLFGAIYSVTLRLVPRRTLERVVEIRDAEGLAQAFDERIRSGFLYGDFQFMIDPADPGFLRRGVFSCYRPVEGGAVPAGQRALTRDDWRGLLHLAHVDKAEAWRRYSEHYTATSGQLYLSDAHQLAEYLEGYHAWLDMHTGSPFRGTEMITELYVPRDRLAAFLADAAADLREHRVDVVYGTVRLIERDDETLLAWAREPWACIVMNLHVEHTREGLEHSAEAFRRLIDLALARGGSYFLTYHRWARRDQVEAAHPRFRDFLAAKRDHDPDERFSSDWYRHNVRLLG
jgi:FAD/FMN-containing dehydrogenase